MTLFLFDKELVICKKELIKRSSLVYKDRLTVEDIEVLEPLTVVDVRPHSFQMRSFSRAKAYLLACRSAQDKNQWIAAIQHLQHHSSEWPVFPAPSNTMTFGRQKMSNKRSKGKQLQPSNGGMIDLSDKFHQFVRTFLFYNPEGIKDNKLTTLTSEKK